MGSTFLRGIRNDDTAQAFPTTWFWCVPSFDSSAKIGQVRFQYTATRDFDVVDVGGWNDPHISYLLSVLGDEYHHDLLNFSSSSNVKNELVVLNAVHAVRRTFGIKGIHRVQGDGPVFIFFSDMITDCLTVDCM